MTAAQQPVPSQPATLPTRRLLLGSLLALVTVTIWAVWIVGMRQAVTTELPIAWVALIRFGFPALVLLPFWWRIGLWPSGVDKRLLVVIVAGAGALFFFVAATGMRFAAVAEIGVLLPGTMPLFVALFSAAIDGERFTGTRIAGFVLVVAAMLSIGGPALWFGHNIGMLIIPCAALAWAAYTIAFRKSGLEALPAAGLIAAWSALVFLPFALAGGASEFFAADPWVLVGQFLTQGVLSGVIAIVCYGAAIRMIGSSRAAVFSALAPALAALIAIPVLGEVPGPLAVVGVGLAVAGVALASGAITFRRRN